MAIKVKLSDVIKWIEQGCYNVVWNKERPRQKSQGHYALPA